MAKRLKIPPVRFILKDKSESETLIYLAYRYIPNGKRLIWSTGEKVDPKYWDKRSRRAKSTKHYPEYPELNNRLDILARIAVDIFKEHGFGNIEVDAFRTELDYRTGKVEPKQEKRFDLVNFAKYFVQLREDDPSAKAGTTKVLRTVSNILEDYQGEIPFEDVDFNFREDFKRFLFTQKGHSINYVSKVFSVIRQFMREAMRRDLHRNTKFEDFTIKKVKVKYPVLNQREIKKLEGLDLSENARLEKMRDLFLIGCYTGQRFGDMTSFKPSDFYEVNGQMLLKIARQKKTSTPDVVIPVLPMLQQVMEKYGFKSPKISNQTFNEYIKEVCHVAGINSPFETIDTTGGKIEDVEFEKWEKVSSHSCRRTFISLAKHWGISEGMIQKVTGHATAKMLNHYDHGDKEESAIEFAKLFKANWDRGGLKAVK